MSVAAVMLVKDEADIIGATIDYLATQVDEILVLDNLSTDGTREILLARTDGVTLKTWTDDEPAYYQSRKTTALAMRALEFGHQWVVPVDADEVWYAPEGRRLADYLEGVPPDVQIATAELFNHLPTGEDPPDFLEPNPLRRIGWRQRQKAPLGKVAARLRPDLVIEAGNHSARTSGTALAASGLVIRHFSWRSAEQYVRKIRNGEAAYDLTDLPADIGAHWRAFAGKPDEAVADHFRAWFYSAHPRKDATLIYDPAPIGPSSEADTLPA